MKVVAICGSVGKDVEELYDLGFDGIFGSIPKLVDQDELMKQTTANVIRVTEAISRLLK